MKEKIKNLNVFKLYSFLFIIVYLIVFIPLSIRNLNIGFTGLFTDGFTQHVIFMRDYIGNIKDFIFNDSSFPLFDLNLGLGADTIASYGYYGLFDPFNIISIILPLKWIEFSYYLILFIKLYLSGLFFLLFAKKILLKNKWALVSSSLLYVFNSCMLLSVLRHPIFAGIFMILPLVLLGAYKIIVKEKPYILIFSTLYAVLSQFYLYAYIAFGFEIFVLIKSYIGKDNKKEYFKNIIKTNLYFLLGSLLGSFVLLSELYAVINGGRSSGNVMINYSTGYYATLIFGQLLPTPVMSYSNSIGNFLATILVIIFIICIKKEKWLKTWLCIQLPLLLVSIFGYALSLFSYVNNRWAFIIIVPICLIVGLMIENVKEIKREDLNKALKICSYMFIIALALALNYLVKNYLRINIIFSFLLRGLIIFIFLLLILLINRYNFNKIKIKSYDSYSFSKYFIKVNVILIFLFNIGMCFCLTDGYVINKYYNNEFNSSLIEDNSFYRVSKYGFAGNFVKHANDSIYGNYSSTFFYNSVNNSNILDFVDFFNINNENANVGYNGVGKRYILETISGVKYYISKESENRNSPYNFSYYDSYKSIRLDDKDLNIIYDKLQKDNGKYVYEENKIYINNNYLPLGFVYNQYVTKSDLNTLTPLERQTYLSKAIILDKNSDYASKYNYKIHDNLIKELPYEIVKTHNLSIKENQIYVSSSDNYIEINVTNLANSEIYLELTGVENKNRYNKTVIEYSSEDENWVETIFNLGENFYIDNYDHLLYLGYDNEYSPRTIKIKFKNSGTYNYDDLKIYSLSMDSIIDDINKLNSTTLDDMVIKNNMITGNVTMQDKGILFLSIPYNKGFEAYVNDKKVDIIKANICYMALELNEGNNKIKITYETPYLSLGLKISLFSGIILFAISTIDLTKYIVKKKKQAD